MQTLVTATLWLPGILLMSSLCLKLCHHLGKVQRAFNPSTSVVGEETVDFCEFETSQIHITSSRTAGTVLTLFPKEQIEKPLWPLSVSLLFMWSS